MHPIERLRYVARAKGGDQRLVVRETASALRGLGLDTAGLLVACRRIVERHPASGPLWWLCSSVLAAPDPMVAASRLAAELEADPTPDVLVDVLPADATVCLIGWPDLIGEAILRRGDLTALAVDAGGEGAAFVRRLERADVAAEVVEPAGVASAVLHADVVLIEALAASPTDVVATCGSRAAASVGYTSEVPVWLVVGAGRCLPEATLGEMAARITDLARPWHAEAEAVPTALASHLVRPDGLTALGDRSSSLAAECPPAPELFRASPV